MQKRTKENLSRVKDIRDEIGRLIKRLENQAKAAEKYKVLKEKEEFQRKMLSLILKIRFLEKLKKKKQHYYNNTNIQNLVMLILNHFLELKKLLDPI